MSWDKAVMPRLMSHVGAEQLPEQVDGPAQGGGAVIQYEWRGAWVVVAHGSYDLHSITPLADALETAARKHPKVVLDASGVAFADSALLNLLILVHRSVTLRVAAPPQQLRQLLEITGVDTVLETRETVDDAALS
ncbi:STAS domain-containing protein [Streptomyces sp. NPDC015220]|uniref:STAS domain-containing protein n=1 Tax=Streptomyces sp. NPDC015220 TaxID=3364947 RepID=UPI0036F4FDE5